MLREVRNLRQDATGFRRWWNDDAFDLIVWYDHPDGEPTGFQLCYSVRGDEHAVTWTPRHGFAHNRVDQGEGNDDAPWGLGHATPILVPDGVFPFRAVTDRFRAAAETLDPDLADHVLRHLEAYPGERGHRLTERLPPPPGDA